jgi:hypothetical protein
MKKLSFLKSSMSIVLLLAVSMLFTNCSSSHDDDDVPTNNTKTFDPAGFSLNITKKDLNSDYLRIDFTKTSYLEFDQGQFIVKFTAKTTDGEIFQRTIYVEYVEAGVTYTDWVHLNFTAGKKLDLSTLTAVIIKG